MAAQLGDVLIGRLSGARPPSGRRVLLVGHMDTVFHEGTAAERPFADRGRTRHSAPASPT